MPTGLSHRFPEALRKPLRASSFDNLLSDDDFFRGGHRSSFGERQFPRFADNFPNMSMRERNVPISVETTSRGDGDSMGPSGSGFPLSRFSNAGTMPTRSGNRVTINCGGDPPTNFPPTNFPPTNFPPSNRAASFSSQPSASSQNTTEGPAPRPNPDIPLPMPAPEPSVAPPSTVIPLPMPAPEPPVPPPIVAVPVASGPPARKTSIADVGDKIVSMLDEIERRVEALRDTASLMEDEKQQLMEMLNTVQVNKDMLRLGTGEKEDIDAAVGRLISRCKTVQVSVSTPRNKEQERALKIVNAQIEEVLSKMREDVEVAREVCKRYLNACSPDQPDGPIDQKFQVQLIECSGDDQKKVRRRLEQILDLIDRSNSQQ